MSTPVKLTEQELQKVQELQNNYATITAQLGQLKIEMILINEQLKRLTDLETTFTQKYLSIQTEEEQFAKSISEKYGDGDINIETGEFLPATHSV
jgi:predicted nuclease with TOPRIM domain